MNTPIGPFELSVWESNNRPSTVIRFCLIIFLIGVNNETFEHRDWCRRFEYTVMSVACVNCERVNGAPCKSCNPCNILPVPKCDRRTHEAMTLSPSFISQWLSYSVVSVKMNPQKPDTFVQCVLAFRDRTTDTERKRTSAFEKRSARVQRWFEL